MPGADLERKSSVADSNAHRISGNAFSRVGRSSQHSSASRSEPYIGRVEPFATEEARDLTLDQLA
jgi:hypothetical protein